MTPVRIDEVSKHYRPAVMAKNVGVWLFWIVAAISLCMPYSNVLNSPWQGILKAIFIALVITHFAVTQISKLYLVPKAERMRRRQMLSDAFATPLSHDRTSLYYNNEYSPSVMRLGANIMENALFSKEVAGRMLHKSRAITGGYVIVWILAFALRHNNLAVLTWITQIVFSGAIVAQWMNLEFLRFRHEQTYERLHDHFLHEIGADSQRAIATVLDAFVTYEATKASAGILLSEKVFNELNPSLTERWDRIRQELNMNRAM